MESRKLSEFIRGWFVGGFSPTFYSTNDVEVAIQSFNKGDVEASHCHKIATEITVVIDGKVRMNQQVFTAGELIKIAPGEYCEFEALEDSRTVVVKLPGALNDKYIKES